MPDRLTHLHDDDFDCATCDRRSDGQLEPWPCREAKAQLREDYPRKADLLRYLGTRLVLVGRLTDMEPAQAWAQIVAWVDGEPEPEPEPLPRRRPSGRSNMRW